MTPVAKFCKDQSDTLDYEMDWSKEIGAQTIATSVWTSLDGMTVVSQSKTSQKTKVVLYGGAAGFEHRAMNSIVTSLGLELQRTIVIRCEEK